MIKSQRNFGHETKREMLKSKTKIKVTATGQERCHRQERIWGNCGEEHLRKTETEGEILLLIPHIIKMPKEKETVGKELLNYSPIIMGEKSLLKTFNME